MCVFRTMMAADRTLMAWIRTSLSMLSFGYAIYKVLQEVKDIDNVAIRGTAPRRAGILLTVAGTAALVMGITAYSGTLRMLSNSYSLGLARPSLILSVVMAAADVLLRVGIARKLL